ncbi:hypothetical protein GCM10025857_28080 [Alicyclobacillus contaminans]|nr:hypothetical protein GCM10025857_28080 [Alicyclobacillus contaminans]
MLVDDPVFDEQPASDRQLTEIANAIHFIWRIDRFPLCLLTTNGLSGYLTNLVMIPESVYQVAYANAIVYINKNNKLV